VSIKFNQASSTAPASLALSTDIAAAVSEVARRWAESMTDLPLIITKSPTGVLCATDSRMRYTAAAFAKLMGMSPNTWRKRVKEHLGLAPATDGQYDAETVAWARQQLKMEESRATPFEIRRRRQSNDS
jgi:hypothetical protein